MSNGLKSSSDVRLGFTMVEVLISVLLLAVVFMAVAALQIGSHRFFLTSKDKVIVGHEVQYALEHIYEHVFTGKGDKNDPAIDLVSSTEFSINYIDKKDSVLKTGRYRITEEGVLEFDSEDDGVFDESLGSNATFIPAESEFSLSGNLLSIKLTAEFPLARADEAKQRLTLYSASYPRCASFQ